MVVIGLAAAGCGGSSNAPATGPLSLQVVDAPIDPSTIDRVCIPFSAVTLNYAGNADVRLDYEPAPTQVSSDTHCLEGGDTWDGTGDVPPVRLDALSGALSVFLIDSMQVPVGRITWIRLHFWDRAYLFDSSQNIFDVACTSCEVTDNNQGKGFKLNRTFEMTATGLSLIVDVDLRQSLLHENSTGYVLRPTARVELAGDQGTIAGSVEGAVIIALEGTEYSGGDTDTGCAVYVYADDVVAADDFYFPDSPVITTAAVRYVIDAMPPGYRYAAGALPVEEDGGPRDYQVALTCDLDDPETDDMMGDVVFTALETVTVNAGETTEHNFN